MTQQFHSWGHTQKNGNGPQAFVVSIVVPHPHPQAEALIPTRNVLVFGGRAFGR